MSSSKVFVLLLFLICEIISEDIKLADNSLLMVHVLFRHGERTTESFYPLDPLINETFFPFGRGQLTNRGKLQGYQLGQFLRKRYNRFLGNIYAKELVKVRSTGFPRTRISALLVAAGLWPPSKVQIWNDQLLWLPIPVDYKPYEEDDLLNPGACLKRVKILKQQMDDEKVKKLFVEPYKDLMDYVEKNSGKPMKTLQDLSELYLILKTEDDTNYTLPEWTKTIYPEPLYSAVSKTYNYFNYNPEIKKINAGYFCKKILDDFHSKMKESAVVPKMFLYCGHESTLGHILDVLKVEPHVSDYGSAVIFELHRNKDKKYVIKILYKRKTNEINLEPIVYPDCNNYCSVYEFQDLMKDILPNIEYKEACKTD